MSGRWQYKIDLKELWTAMESLEDQGKDLDEIALEFGSRVAGQIRQSEPYEKHKYVLEEICQQFEEADCQDAFNWALQMLYDWADVQKTCWVATVL